MSQQGQILASVDQLAQGIRLVKRYQMQQRLPLSPALVLKYYGDRTVAVLMESHRTWPVRKSTMNGEEVLQAQILFRAAVRALVLAGWKTGRILTGEVPDKIGEAVAWDPVRDPLPQPEYAYGEMIAAVWGEVAAEGGILGGSSSGGGGGGGGGGTSFETREAGLDVSVAEASPGIWSGIKNFVGLKNTTPPKIKDDFQSEIRGTVPMAKTLTKPGAAQLRSLSLYEPGAAEEDNTPAGIPAGALNVLGRFKLPTTPPTNHDAADHQCTDCAQESEMQKNIDMGQAMALLGFFNRQAGLSQALRCDPNHHNLEQRRDVMFEGITKNVTITAGGDLVALIGAALFGDMTTPTNVLFSAASSGPNKNRYKGMTAAGLAVYNSYSFIPDTLTDASELARVDKAIRAAMDYLLTFGIKALRNTGSGNIASSPVPLLNFAYGPGEKREFKSIGDFTWQEDSQLQIVSPLNSEAKWSMDAAGAVASAHPTHLLPTVAGKVLVNLGFFVEFMGSLSEEQRQELERLKAAAG